MGPHEVVTASTMTADSMGGSGALAIGLFMLVGAEHRARAAVGGVAVRVYGGLDWGRKAWAAVDQTLANIGTIITGVIAAAGAAYGAWKWNKKRNEENAKKAKELAKLPVDFKALQARVEVLAGQAEVAEARYKVVVNDYATLQSVLEVQTNTITRLNRKIAIRQAMDRLGVPRTATWYLCDADGVCIDASDDLCTLFGRAREKMMGNGWLGPVVDKDGAYKAWDHAIRNDIPYESRYQINVRGQIINIGTRAEKITVDGEVLYVGDCWPIEEGKTA